jgi:hypothetical protein
MPGRRPPHPPAFLKERSMNAFDLVPALGAEDVDDTEPAMLDLAFELRQIAQRNRDGSFATQADRRRMLGLFAKQLHEGGFRHMAAASLKPKHVEYLLGRWQSEGLCSGTLKNRLGNLRWWAEKIGKPNVIPRDNDSLGIERRRFVTNVDKGKDLAAEQLTRVTCEYTRLSLRLEAEFGLRREESLKIQPAWADRGTVLRLKDSWTKGGRPRDIPIVTGAQRALLDEAKRFAGQGSLIPESLLYRDQLKTFRTQCERVGIHGVHGLRHRYAQRRYLEQTGWACPAAGGPSRRALSAEQREVDTRVRLEISAELGHARLQVVAIYLGS